MRILSSTAAARHFVFLVRCGIAAVFVIAALSKMTDPSGTSTVLRFILGSSLTLSQALGLVAAAAGLEVAVALALLYWPRSKYPVTALTGILIFFLLIQTYLAMTPGAPDCGCFGSLVQTGTAFPAAVHGIFLNAGLLALVLCIWPRQPRVQPESQRGDPNETRVLTD